MLKAFPGQEGGNKGVRINIARIYDQQYNNILGKMYTKVDVTNTMGSDEPMDAMGYLGLTDVYRIKP